MQYEEKTHFAKNCALRGAYRRGLSVCGTHAEGGKQTEQLQLLEELKGVYGNYTKKLTVNDQQRLDGLLKKTEDAPYRPVLEYMKAYEVKLEQEIIRYSAAFR